MPITAEYPEKPKKTNITVNIHTQPGDSPRLIGKEVVKALDEHIAKEPTASAPKEDEAVRIIRAFNAELKKSRKQKAQLERLIENIVSANDDKPFTEPFAYGDQGHELRIQVSAERAILIKEAAEAQLQLVNDYIQMTTDDLHWRASHLY